MTTDPQRSHWDTGACIRLCECGTDRWPPSPCLPVYTDGRREWAHCPTCGKTWEVETIDCGGPIVEEGHIT